MPQAEINLVLAILPTETEVEKAIKLLSNGKAPGPDAIPAEVDKVGGAVLVQKLTELFPTIWRQEAVPEEPKDASIIHLYKKKGEQTVL